MIISKVDSLLKPGTTVDVILTGLDRPSKNAKTGPMAQLKFAPQDINPVMAAETGEDLAVCVKNCIHRPLNKVEKEDGSTEGGTCYVDLKRGILSSWKAHQGKAVEILTTLKSRAVRFGEWGDPSTVRRALLDHVISIARREHRHPRPWTGYTHDYDKRPDLKDVCMASTDTIADRERAKANGWRTFRPRPVGAPLLDGEIDCPYVTRGVQCADCLLCNGGAHGKDISIEIH